MIGTQQLAEHGGADSGAVGGHHLATPGDPLQRHHRTCSRDEGRGGQRREIRTLGAKSVCERAIFLQFREGFCRERPGVAVGQTAAGVRVLVVWMAHVGGDVGVTAVPELVYQLHRQSTADPDEPRHREVDVQVAVEDAR